jgi:hypothetical protein
LIVVITFGEEYKLWSSVLCIFIISLLLGQSILSALFSNTLGLCSSLNARDQVSDSFCSFQFSGQRIMKSKLSQRNWSWPNLRYCLVYRLEGLEKCGQKLKSGWPLSGRDSITTRPNTRDEKRGHLASSVQSRRSSKQALTVSRLSSPSEWVALGLL